MSKHKPDHRTGGARKGSGRPPGFPKIKVGYSISREAAARLQSFSKATGRPQGVILEDFILDDL